MFTIHNKNKSITFLETMADVQQGIKQPNKANSILMDSIQNIQLHV